MVYGGYTTLLPALFMNQPPNSLPLSKTRGYLSTCPGP